MLLSDKNNRRNQVHGRLRFVFKILFLSSEFMAFGWDPNRIFHSTLTFDDRKPMQRSLGLVYFRGRLLWLYY